MAITVTKIRAKSTDNWTALPVPMSVTGGSQTIDSADSGRDNNTGLMYRDIVRNDVSTVSCTLPAGLTNIQMKDVLNIILGKSFQMYLPDVRKGFFATRTFYVASAEPVNLIPKPAN